MIKNSTFDVYERMDKKALETMALAFEADAAVAASIQGLEFIKARLGIVYALLKYKIHNDWLPTPENINTLPEPIRKYIHDLETNVDPTHIVRENILIKDTCTALVLKLEEKKRRLSKVICLCGSTRFTEAMLIHQWELTKKGFIVLSWCALPDSYFKGKDKHHIGDQEGVKEVVDEIHLRKIDLADEVMILNVGGYVGESTRNELIYARKKKKVIRFLEPEKK